MNSPHAPHDKARRGKSRMPERSFLYEKLIPLLLIGLAVLTLACIVIAAGILLGFIPYR